MGFDTFNHKVYHNLGFPYCLNASEGCGNFAYHKTPERADSSLLFLYMKRY